MTSFANRLSVNLAVTGLVLVMVFLLPWTDRRLSRRLGLDLTGGVSANPRAESLLRTRRLLLYAIFALYAGAMAYLVFFSRSASESYQVHIAPFRDLTGAIRIDFGLLGLVQAIFSEGFAEAFSHVKIISAANVTQVYMNIMLFVPMGYLLPYLFRRFRARVRYRPVLFCFLLSLLIENLQLIFRRGLYDLDDLLANTLGGFLGQQLYIAVAYVVTHPDWRRERKAYRRWKRNARTRTLYPFARGMGLSRATIMATREEAVWDFYVIKLGFRLLRQIVPLDSEGTDMLLEMGAFQVEIHCSNRDETLPPQTLTLSVHRLQPVLRRLAENGIPCGGIAEDPYTGLRCVRLQGPDGVQICVIEE